MFDGALVHLQMVITIIIIITVFCGLYYSYCCCSVIRFIVILRINIAASTSSSTPIWFSIQQEAWKKYEAEELR